MTDSTVLAKTAHAPPPYKITGFYACEYKRKELVQRGPLVKSNAGGSSYDGDLFAVHRRLCVSEHEHGPRKCGRSLEGYFAADGTYRTGRPVVSIDAHASRTDDDLGSLLKKFIDRTCYIFKRICAEGLADNAPAQPAKLFVKLWPERVFDPLVHYLLAGGHNSHLQVPEGQDREWSAPPDSCNGALDPVVLHHQRSYAEAGYSLALQYRAVRGKGGAPQKVALPDGYLRDLDDATPPGADAEDEDAGG